MPKYVEFIAKNMIFLWHDEIKLANYLMSELHCTTTESIMAPFIGALANYMGSASIKAKESCRQGLTELILYIFSVFGIRSQD
jgi:hypothetical protein